MKLKEGPLGIRNKKKESTHSDHKNPRNASLPHLIRAMEVPSSVKRTTAVDNLTTGPIDTFERSALENDQNGFKFSSIFGNNWFSLWRLKPFWATTRTLALSHIAGKLLFKRCRWPHATLVSSFAFLFASPLRVYVNGMTNVDRWTDVLLNYYVSSRISFRLPYLGGNCSRGSRFFGLSPTARVRFGYPVTACIRHTSSTCELCTCHSLGAVLHVLSPKRTVRHRSSEAYFPQMETDIQQA